MCDSEIDEGCCTPSEVAEMANIATLKLLPEKSRKVYEISYNRFREWCANKGAVQFTENVLLAFFSDRSTQIKPSSLWSEYSMVRASLSVKDNVDIKKYAKLMAFMKRNSVGFRSKKSKIFNREQIYTFLKEAPESEYLMKKVVAIFGIAGACRRDELQKMTTDDIEEVGSVIIVKIPRSKTDKERSFVVKGEVEEGLNLIDIYRKYANLRPKNTPHKRFFIHYRNGKCSVQVVGVNTFAKVPCEIAKYLNLPNTGLYTGHCFRRSSATLLADTGADILSLKRHGGWKSTSVAEGYIEESIGNKITVAGQIFQKELLADSTEQDQEVTNNEINLKQLRVDSPSEYDAVRAYLKELDITNNVWIGLSKTSEKPHFTWTDFRPLSNDGHWQEAIPVGSSPLCAAADPAADFRWHALQCGGPEVAAFICELPVPTWAGGSRGCLLTELPSLTVLYVPEQSAIELTSDCGLDGTKRIACKGNADRDEMMRQLSCSITNEDYDDKATKGPIPASTITEITNPSVSPNIKTTKPWIWTSNTIDTGDYGAPTRHRRETENTLGPASSTRGTTDLTMREKTATHQETTTKPSVFTKQINSREKLGTETVTVSTLNDVTLDLSITQRSDKSPEITATPVHDSTTQESSSQPEEQAETFAIATPTADSKSGDVGQEDTGEYPGVINQGQLFSIIENGTMFDIIELNENGTEETSIGKDSASTQPQDGKKISLVTESTTQQLQTVKTLYTTVIYHKEPPEDLTDKKDKQEKEPKQEVTPTFKIHESKASFNDKNSNKQKTINDLLTNDDDKTLTKEVEMFPIESDSSIKLNRTYRKKLPMIESNLTKENDDILIKTDQIPATQQENSLSEVDDFVIGDETSAHKVVEIKLHKDGNKNATRAKLYITTKIAEKPKRNEKILNNKKSENQTTSPQKESIEKFDDSYSSNSTDMETEVKQTEIDPRLEILNTKGVNKTRNIESEIISPITSTVERMEQGDLKKQFLPRPLIEDSENDKSQEVVVEEPQETVSTIVNSSGEPMEPVPQQQPRPNRQRLLTKPQRRSFYPYFFSRVLG